jgi:hypothetical protein
VAEVTLSNENSNLRRLEKKFSIVPVKIVKVVQIRAIVAIM